MSNPKEAEDVIAKAAAIAAPVFAREGWRWAHVGVPAVDDIADVLRHMVQEVSQDTQYIEAGHFGVRRDQDGVLDVYLMLGHIYDEGLS